MPTEMHAEECLDADDDLSPAMVRRLARAGAEEKVGGPDPLVDDPSVDLDMYCRIMRMRVSERALSRRRIYLDLNYWIWLRDAAFQQPKLPIHMELWRRLTELAKSGLVFCPVSYPVYSEVLKQDDASRRRTACVVDRLCGRICIVDQSSRIIAQLSHFVWTRLLGDRALPPADRFVWTSPFHILGMSYAKIPGWPAEANLKQQKMWLRYTRHLRFSDLTEQTRGRLPTETNNWRHTLLQNFMCNRTRDSLRSLKATYKIEVGSSTDLIAKDIADFAADLFDKGIRSPLGPEPSPRTLRLLSQAS